VHTLDIISKNWYIELEVCRGTGDWKELTEKFKVTFSFENNNSLIDSALQVIKNNILVTEGSIYSTPRVTATVEEVFLYYNVFEEEHEDEVPRNLQIT
jgi:hypothetical protein